MLTLATFLMTLTLARQAGTTHVIAYAERDLTGDGKPETLRLVGVGPMLDDLGVTFTIESAGTPIYRRGMERMRRTAVRPAMSPAQYRTWLDEYAASFFGKGKFQRPDEFVELLRTSARRHIAEIPNVIADDQQASDTVPAHVIWEDIQQASVTIFTFSPGGDRIIAIGWHARTGRFYNLLSCC